MSDEKGGAVGGVTASLIQARWSALRMLRGRMVWVASLFAVLPVALTFLAVSQGETSAWDGVFPPLVMLAAVVAPLFMASAMAEEIEDRTYTYLWSRPVPRWSVVIGKLLAAFPIAGVILTAAVVLCFLASRSSAGDQLTLGVVAVLAGTLAACSISAALAILLPRAGLAITYAYLLALDTPIGLIPFSPRNISITHQIRSVAGVAGVDDPIWKPLVWLGCVSAFWLAIAFLRLRRAEFSSGEK